MTDIKIDRRALALFEQWLEVPDQEREAWIVQQAIGEPLLAQRFKALLSSARADELRTGGAFAALDTPMPPATVGAYRIVELIGHGGMGSVFRAERAAGDFTHVVAIKIIKPGFMADAFVERFLRERQTLATLIHPHIARLYDGGETAEGLPYIVMEYVQGMPLVAWAERTGASVERRTALFLDICDAVAFAHSHLIVHRDLTPSNVLVTDQGVVKLIDFGIARTSNDHVMEGAASTDAVASDGYTPGYAAPERLLSDRVTTAADIFSLGRLLERLTPPLSAEGDADLKAIANRACARQPGDRYPTVNALKADVQAWRSGHAVEARGGGHTYRLGKFIKRRPLMLAAATAGFLALTVALGLTTAANIRAQTARTEADNRFQQTRAIAKGMLFDAYDAVSKAPGSTRARKILASLGVVYLDALAADPAAPRDVRLEAGEGFTRLSQVIGGGQSSQLGRYADADALLVRADGILSPLLASDPDDPAVRRAVAALRLEQAGANLYNNGAVERAREQALTAQALLRPYAHRSARDAQLYLAAIQAEGDSWGWADDYAHARTVHQRGEVFFAGLPAKLRDSTEVRTARSANLRLLGEAYHKLDQVEPARHALDEAVAINRTLLAGAADDPVIQRKLVISLWYRGVVHRTNERDADARASSDEAIARARTLMQRDPSDAGAVQVFATTVDLGAQILADAGRFEESYALGAQVIAAHDRLIRLAGGAPGPVRSKATALVTYGGNFYNGDDYVRACATWRQADALFASLERRGALTDTDRKSSWPDLKELLTSNCENGPPRRGMDEI